MFALTMGQGCCKVEEEEEEEQGVDNDQRRPTSRRRTQLYINYGKRTDSDLLLNYGFLTNMDGGEGTGGWDEDERRTQLAKEFVRRNP